MKPYNPAQEGIDAARADAKDREAAVRNASSLVEALELLIAGIGDAWDDDDYMLKKLNHARMVLAKARGES